VKRLEKCRRCLNENRKKLHMQKCQTKISKRCIRLKMLLCERLMRVSSLSTAGPHSIRGAQSVCLKAAKQRWKDKQRIQAYWRVTDVAGHRF